MFYRELLDHIKEFVVKVLESLEQFLLGRHSLEVFRRIFSYDVGVFIIVVVRVIIQVLVNRLAWGRTRE